MLKNANYARSQYNMNFSLCNYKTIGSSLSTVVNPLKYDLSCVTFTHYERHRINPNRADADTPMEGCGVSI
jgi:hypothetical protein